MGVFAIIKHTVDVDEKPVLLSGSLLSALSSEKNNTVLLFEWSWCSSRADSVAIRLSTQIRNL